MATGTTYDFENSRDEIIVDALVAVGACEPNQDASTIDGNVRTHAQRILNDIVKAHDADGLFLWRVVSRTFTTVAAQADYGATGAKIATDVIAVDEPVNYVTSGQTSRTILTAMSRDDYMSLPDRTTAGRPSRYFLEKTLAQPVTMRLWPVPDASGDTIEYAAILRSFDFDAGANTPDFPQRFGKALKLELTSLLAPVYGNQLQLASWYAKRAEEEWGKQTMVEAEHGNLSLVPWGGG